jgi:hypothetical protein
MYSLTIGTAYISAKDEEAFNKYSINITRWPKGGWALSRGLFEINCVSNISDGDSDMGYAEDIFHVDIKVVNTSLSFTKNNYCQDLFRLRMEE